MDSNETNIDTNFERQEAHLKEGYHRLDYYKYYYWNPALALQTSEIKSYLERGPSLNITHPHVFGIITTILAHFEITGESNHAIIAQCILSWKQVKNYCIVTAKIFFPRIHDSFLEFLELLKNSDVKADVSLILCHMNDNRFFIKIMFLWSKHKVIDPDSILKLLQKHFHEMTCLFTDHDERLSMTLFQDLLNLTESLSNEPEQFFAKLSLFLRETPIQQEENLNILSMYDEYKRDPLDLFKVIIACYISVINIIQSPLNEEDEEDFSLIEFLEIRCINSKISTHSDRDSPTTWTLYCLKDISERECILDPVYKGLALAGPEGWLKSYLVLESLDFFELFSSFFSPNDFPTNPQTKYDLSSYCLVSNVNGYIFNNQVIIHASSLALFWDKLWQYKRKTMFNTSICQIKDMIENSSSNLLLKESRINSLSLSRRLWLYFVRIVTFWVFGCCLECFKLRGQERQMAWREKITLCTIIFSISLIMLFFITVFTKIICPDQKIMTQKDIERSRLPLTIVHGIVYDTTKLIPGHNSNGALHDHIIQFLKKDASKLFPLPSAILKSTTSLAKGRSLSRIPHTTEHYNILISTKKKWIYGLPKEVLKNGVAKTNALISIFGKVYNVSPLLQPKKTITSPLIRQAIRAPWGVDKSHFFKKNSQRELQILRDYMIGAIDQRNSIRCQTSKYMLVGSTGILAIFMIIKFLSSLQLGLKRNPEKLDKFVIIMIPCFTENEMSLRKTIDSLSCLNYDDRRKLLFIVADGVVMGDGNQKTTSEIVLDILSAEENYESAKACYSIGKGEYSSNYAKVYSGIYECGEYKVPYIFVAKVGLPEEVHNPGNRGKRDSQLLLLRFLSNIFYDMPLSPLEIALKNEFNNVIGINPSYYEFVLMVDADTQIAPDSLNRMLSCCSHDSNVMGICGETKLCNEKQSWVTMIQVYEYFISHNMSKAFESLFGAVTCLPGCFSLYRIKMLEDRELPILIRKDVLDDYSDSKVDTLHKKNLLSLGEDRYLTTILLKRFTNLKTKFTPDATCKTVAPHQWKVLLSQRRRWINSTIHNLFELLLIPNLCGFSCFSMKFVVIIDLYATLVMPASVIYLGFLIFLSFMRQTVPIMSLIILGSAYGMQVMIFILKREWQHIGWMIIYLLALPLFGLVIPIYSFWHFDDFSWGSTRKFDLIETELHQNGTKGKD